MTTSHEPEPEPWEIWEVIWPFDEGHGSKRRWVLIIRKDGDTYHCMKLSTKPTPSGNHLLLKKTDPAHKPTNLKKDTYFHYLAIKQLTPIPGTYTGGIGQLTAFALKVLGGDI